MFQGLSAAFDPSVALVIAFAGLIRGFSGFGFSLAAVPLLSLVLPLNTVVPLALSLEAIGVLPTLGRIWRHADWGALRTLLAGSIAAMPLGLLILHTGTPWLLRPAVAVCVLVAVMLIWHPPEWTSIRPRAGSEALAGAISGVLNGAAAMSGPPIVLLMFSSERPPEIRRATMMVFFSISAAVTLAAGLASGSYALPNIVKFLVCLPFLALGIEIGTLLQTLFQQATVRRLALLALALSASVSLLGTLHSI